MNASSKPLKTATSLQADSLLSQSLQATVNQEQSTYYPQISASAQVTGLFLSPYTFGQHFLQAVADWDMGRFWKKTAAIQQKQVEQQEAVAQQNRLEIAGVITGLYLDVLQNQLEQRILQSRLDYLNTHIEILTALWKAGTIRQLDILETRSSLNSVKEELMQKELSATQAKYALSRLMGLETTNFSLAPVADDLPPEEVVNQVPESWLDNHPQAMKIQKEYEKELLMKRDVEASYMPHIQAFSGYTFDGDPTGDGNYVLLGIGATVPIYSWKKKDYQLHEIDFKAESIQKQKENTERDLSIRFGQIVQQIRQYKNIIDFQQEKIQTDREAAKMAEINYKAGLSNNLDFLTAQQTLTETQLKMNTVRNQYLKSIVTFWLLTGQSEEIRNILH